jgi:glycosyltransferase involved in cell wall biosynthesis
MNILHVFRSPVGGLFRHVVDLARGQIERGHRVGIVADSLTGNARADEILGALAPKLALGLTRIPMRRQPRPADIAAVWHVARRIGQSGAQIVHGHGAKGGALARLAPAPRGTVRGYTPHGGSLHDAVGTLHILLERLLMRRGNLYLFESAFSHDSFRRKVGDPDGTMRVVHNGVAKEEFEPVALATGAADIVYLGELRALKGTDVLIDAIAALRRQGRPLTATVIGDGPDAPALKAQVARLGLGEAVRFEPPMPARAALALGRILVMPSRAESLPYVALEAAAAGKPIIATKVGGFPEIFGPSSEALVPPDDAVALAQTIAKTLDDPTAADRAAQVLRQRVAAAFSRDSMVDAVLASYEQTLEPRTRLAPAQSWLGSSLERDTSTTSLP